MTCASLTTLTENVVSLPPHGGPPRISVMSTGTAVVFFVAASVNCAMPCERCSIDNAACMLARVFVLMEIVTARKVEISHKREMRVMEITADELLAPIRRRQLKSRHIPTAATVSYLAKKNKVAKQVYVPYHCQTYLYIVSGGRVDHESCFLRDHLGAIYLEPTGMEIVFQRYGHSGVVEVTRSESGVVTYMVHILNEDGTIKLTQTAQEFTSSMLILIGFTHVERPNILRADAIQNALKDTVRSKIILPRTEKLDYNFLELFYEYLDGGVCTAAPLDRLFCPAFSPNQCWHIAVSVFHFEFEFQYSNLLVDKLFVDAINKINVNSNAVACLNRGITCYFFDDFEAANKWCGLAANKATIVGNRMLRYRAMLWMARTLHTMDRANNPSIVTLLSEILADSGSWTADTELVAQVRVWHGWCVWRATREISTLIQVLGIVGTMSALTECDLRCRIIVASLKDRVEIDLVTEITTCLRLLDKVGVNSTLGFARLNRCIGTIMLIEGDGSFDVVDVAFRALIRSVKIEKSVRPKMERVAATIGMIAELANVSGVFCHIVDELRDTTRDLWDKCNTEERQIASEFEAIIV